MGMYQVHGGVLYNSHLLDLFDGYSLLTGSTSIRELGSDIGVGKLQQAEKSKPMWSNKKTVCFH